MRQIILLIMGFVLLTGCKKQLGCMDPLAPNYNPTAEQDDGSCLPFQGPRNAGFEYGGEWQFDRSSNSSCGYGIISESPVGLGFMPTQGKNYLYLVVGSGFSFAYQDNVDLSYSSKLIFDYQFYGADQDGSVLAEIIFIGDENHLIWSKQLTSVNQVAGEVVHLPEFAKKGKLLIRLGNDSGVLQSGQFEIDNIRTE